jgi:Tol biopolymer transport system component/type II secretory pathway pseudopilin PulG
VSHSRIGRNIPKRYSRKGQLAFTLIEAMVAVALLGIVLASVGPTFRKSSVTTKGAAISLAAALTEARQQAITQQVPVALVIPSDNGAQGQADAYYIASGEQPRVTLVKWFGGEQPDLRLMVGHWPLDTAKLNDSTLTTTVTPPPEATWENDFDVDLWGLAQPKDYAFIFNPRGKLVTNGLPHFDGAYHIIVSHGGTSTVAGLADTSGITNPPTLYSPTQVGSPYTVSIDPAGFAWVSPGVVGAPDGETYLREQAQVTPAPPLPVLSPPASSPPVVTSVTLLPDPTKLEPPTGVDILLAPGRHMTMTMRAQSPDGVPLFCEWKATGGGLSSPREVRTTYLPQSQEWESVWQWRFPADAKPGDQFKIEGVVKDSQGNEVPLGLGAGQDPFVVQVGDPSVRVAFDSTRSGTRDAYVVNADGTGLVSLTDDPEVEFNVVWSPDGSRVAFPSDRGGNREVVVVHADGTGLKNLTNNPALDHSPVWSPDGGRIAFGSNRDGNMELYVMNADGSSQTRLTSTPGDESFVSWSPDGNQLAFCSSDDLYIINADGTGMVNLTNSASREFWTAWSPDSTQLAFSTNQDGNYEVYKIKPDGTGQTNLSNNVASDSSPLWSSDGSRILFLSSRDGNQEIYSMNPDGSGKLRLTNHPLQDQSPSWFQDGRRFASASARSGNHEIYLTNSDGTGLINLTKAPGNDLSPAVR